MQAIDLNELELAAGIALGEGEPRPLAGAAGEPLQALEHACLPALAREPCLVSFSGGGDSSVVLAAAIRAAARHGLSPPVPVTLRFPHVPSAAETRWQELVIAHLGIRDWERIELNDELDFLGPLARAGLSDHGLLWPANAHFHVPILQRASGGSVLTGVDGDGLLGTWRWCRAQAVLSRRRRPEPRDVFRVGLALAPAPLRGALLALRRPVGPRWLTATGRRRLARALVRDQAAEPRRWHERVAWLAGRRYLEVGLHSLSLLGRDRAVEVHHPLLAPEFLAAVAAHGGAAGYGSRAAATQALFGGLLPAEVVGRRTKAEFGGALWGPEARAFAAAWDGSGIDPELVDSHALRASWREPNPPLAAATLLHHAWLQAGRTA